MIQSDICLVMMFKELLLSNIFTREKIQIWLYDLVKFEKNMFLIFPNTISYIYGV